MNNIEHLQAKIDQMVPLIYLLTEDEHRTILGIEQLSQKHSAKFTTEVFIYKSTTGIIPIAEYKVEIDQKRGATNGDTIEINHALIHIHTQNRKDRRQVYIITEADQHLADEQVVRRIKDFAVQADNSDSNLKIVILMSSRLNLPSKLEKHVDVVVYPYPSEDEIKQEVTNWLGKFNAATKDGSKKIAVRDDFEVINALKGLIIPQIHQNLTACIDVTRKQNKGKGFLDPTILNSFKKEAINKTSLITFKEPEVGFADCGGLGRLKQWLRTMHGSWTNEGQKFGLPILKGVMLIGLPGCGKSRIAEATASEYNLNLIKFDPSKVFSSQVGASEGNMHMALARIESLAPCILFIDEIEKGFAGIQSSSMSDAGTTARTIGIYLMWMNDNKSHVFSVSTCNQIHYLPPELIERYDEIFYVGLPNKQEREEILAIQIRENKRDPKKFNLPKLADACNYLSGRKIQQGVKDAMFHAFSKFKVDGKTDLTNEILENSLKRKIPLIKTMEKQLEYLIKWVGYDKETRDGVRARFANNEEDEIDAIFTEILEKVQNTPASDQGCPPQEPSALF